MKFLLLVVAQALVNVAAFAPIRPHSMVSQRRASDRRLMVLGAVQRSKKEKAAIQEDRGYWEGEWVCADCGYIYDDTLFGGLFFEEQTKGFKCPQCSGPRRRYAKKIGDTVGVTLDGGDGPILAASFIGVVVTFALGIYFTFN
eukprot:FR740369.1.p1 GENE.FR740369.1~~FR740369.1.p1  ORF type:complete len:143 (+),score=8.84 FR740369.1:56-484(+)